MKKYKLKKWVLCVGYILLITISILLLSSLLNYQNNIEKERAYQAGRTQIHYTSLGEIYYK